MYAELINGGQVQTPSRRPLSRRLHRALAMLFTATVAANFVAMIFGPPPAIITYAPLLPLLVLMVTGWIMLLRRKGAGR